MQRREFSKWFGLSLGAAAIGVPFAGVLFAYAPQPQVAITIDDFNLFGATDAEREANSSALLAALKRHADLKVAAFICGARVDSPIGRRIVGMWNDAGHLIANHTYSHWYYHDRKPDEFAADALRCEALLKGYARFTRLFRFPMLKEGDTIERRDGMRHFLREHSYRHGHVTIDASDWYVDQRLRARLLLNSKAATKGFRDFYLDHILDRSRYYDDLAQRLLGRPVKHTLLIHHNLLNQLFLDDLLTMYERKGWQLINADAAFADPVFKSEPKILPAGESLIWALAKESGRFEKELRYPGEDGEYEKAKMDKLGL